MLPIPFLSSFPEINVRTYVSFGGKPGIYFLSLDAASALAVAAARRFYRLPYFQAHMTIDRDADGLRYRSERKASESAPAAASVVAIARWASCIRRRWARSSTG